MYLVGHVMWCANRVCKGDVVCACDWVGAGGEGEEVYGGRGVVVGCDKVHTGVVGAERVGRELLYIHQA
jgi:hypothetical protein